MNSQNLCKHCGSQLEQGSQYCENCGNPVMSSQHNPVTETHYPDVQASPSIHAQTPAPNQRKWIWVILILCLGCLCFFCFGVLIFGGFVYVQNQPESVLGVIGDAESFVGVTEVISEPTATFTAVPTQEIELPTKEAKPIETTAPDPTDEPEPTNSKSASPPDGNNGLTGEQLQRETSIFDDFSSKALGWPEYDDGLTILKYEDDAYSFQIVEIDYYDWAYVPVDFWPNSITFDMWGLPGEQDGTFGVMCQYQDADNYNYVEFDMVVREYIVGQIKDGEFVPLTEEKEEGQYWYETTAIKPSPEDVNFFSVTCYPDLIVLAINDTLVYSTEVGDPFADPGEIAFFVYTYSFAGPEGYKVFFDNVGVYNLTE